MLKNLYFFLLLLFFSFNGVAQFNQVKVKIYFDIDKYDLRENEKEKLQNLMDTIPFDSITKICILGNTDNTADSMYNVILSENRCNTVKGFFDSYTINPKVFTINYFGEDKPIAPNTTDSGKQENRRVDLRIIHKKISDSDINDNLSNNDSDSIFESEIIDDCEGSVTPPKNRTG